MLLFTVDTRTCWRRLTVHGKRNRKWAFPGNFFSWDCSAAFNWFNRGGVTEIATLKEMEQTGEKKRGEKGKEGELNGCNEREKWKGGKSSFQFNRVGGRVRCVFGLSFFGSENKIYLAWSLHLSLRNNTNSISPRRVIRNVIYRFCAQIGTLGNCFVVLQRRWHAGPSVCARRRHLSPFQCVPALAKSMLASVAVMEMCSLTKHITQWSQNSSFVHSRLWV